MKKSDHLSPSDIANRIKVGIYIAAIIFFLIALTMKIFCAEAFWPPDMIPHPTPPWDDPRRQEEDGPKDCVKFTYKL